MQTPLLKIGTRGSRLALAQAHETRDRLASAHGAQPDAFEIVIIKTTGDAVRDRPLAEIGGKGLFTKEIEEALIAGAIDVAVHSMKDMPAQLPDGLAMAAYLEREDPRDGFISSICDSPGALPAAAVVGSSSVRRSAQLKRLRPDLSVVPFRGNVETRLKKLVDGEVAATFLACAGLNRLGLADRLTRAMEPEEMLPAVAQGAIGLEIRAADERVLGLVAPLDHDATRIAISAERGFLAELDGSCRTPLAGHAMLNGDRVRLRVEALSIDGQFAVKAERSCLPADAEAAGRDAGREVRDRGGSRLLSH